MTSKRDECVSCQVSNSEHNFDHNLESERWKTYKEDMCKNELPRICFDQAGVTFV